MEPVTDSVEDHLKSVVRSSEMTVLAEQAKHLSVYVNAAEDGEYLIQQRADRFGPVKVGSAALTFTTLEDLDHAEFRSLIARARALNPGVV